MNNFIISLVLLVLILIFVGINAFRICSVCEEIVLAVESGDVDRAKNLWNQEKHYIAFFVRDAEVDVVNAEVQNLDEEKEFEDGEAAEDIVKFRDAVLELIYSEKPSFQNIF